MPTCDALALPAPEGQDERVMQLVARDGIEPPTPAFSGLPTDPDKGLWNQRNSLIWRRFLGCHFGTIQAHFGSSEVLCVRVLFAPN